MANFVDLSDIDVIAPNFKVRLSGVTSTIIQLVPKQNYLGTRIAVCGSGLPAHLPQVNFIQFWKLWNKPRNAKYRVWHARRNIEMLPAIIMRDILRMKLKIVFTSASQRNHTGYTKWLISKMDHVIATSRKSAQYLSDENSVVMHGIDLERFIQKPDKSSHRQSLGLDPDQKYIGCFGRIRRQKGTDLFVDTMLKVLPEQPEWTALIAGRATAEHVQFERDLRQKVERAGLNERIKFIGEHKDIEKWYQAIDLYIAPQRWEGFGLTPLEAGACAVPTLAADVGAFSELIIEGETGHIFKPNDLDAMIKTTLNYLAMPKQWSQYSENALTHMKENFALEREARSLNDIYRQLAQPES